LQQSYYYKSHHTLYALLHYLVKHQCPKTSDILKLMSIHHKIGLPGSVATHSRFGEIFNRRVLFYKFIASAESANEKKFKSVKV